jgi:hypothetical protein
MRTILTLLIALITPQLNAQLLERRPVTIGGGLEVGVPIGEFNDSYGKEIFGLAGNFTVPMGLLPVDWGFDFGWGRMGAESQEVPISEEHLDATTGDLRVNSDIYSYHGILRLKPFNGKVSPYFEGMLGARQFTTKTQVRVEGMDQPYLEQRNMNEFIWSHGWAAGIQYTPGKMFYLELRAERLDGGQVQYVDPSTISVSDEGVVDFSTLNSGTRVVNVQIGIGLRF